jgi:retron-type reverse transcriptase
LSNTEARYKYYFRDSYSAFALASDTALKKLRHRGLSDRYVPAHASKVMIPKASGTLRPLTLLTLEDQIVYQACVNVIAELLKPWTRHRYYSRVYAHLYSGKSSPFFYRNWQVSYRLMGNAIRANYAKGFVFVATFDLTAFYDSIDHLVLTHFLENIRLDRDAIDFLMRCLRQWTSSTWTNGPVTIYHGHGIPQGPLPSGMLSEVVLQHIDKVGERGYRTKYIRYVDDIKIFAKNEEDLRRKIVALDIASKEIGLFPQTSKINIRRVRDPGQEIKTLSSPAEPTGRTAKNQKQVISRLLELTRRAKVDAGLSNRFKFVLSQALPSGRISTRLLAVLKNHPEYGREIGLYFSRYEKIHARFAADIIAYVINQEIYHSVNGDVLRGCLGKFSARDTSTLGRFAADRLSRPSKSHIRLQPTYKEALIAWAIHSQTITYADVEALRDKETDWWVRKCILREMTIAQFGAASFMEYLNGCIRINEGEIARCAAAQLVSQSISVTKPHKNISEPALIILQTTNTNSR